MPFRLNRMPLTDAERVVSPGGADLTIRPFQPVVWVRLVPWVGAAADEAVVFPAVVDTGNNHSFLIPGPLFRAWARVDYRALPARRQLLVNRLPIPCYGFNLDLFRPRGGEPTGRIAARLQTGQGVAVIPDVLVTHFPRLPVLGVRCLTVNRMRFTVSGDTRTFSLGQPG